MKAQLGTFRAVIFDCDGVLVDSERSGLRSLQQALREAGVDRSLDYLARFSGRSHGETLAELEAESGVSLMAAGVARRMDDCYIRLVTEEGLDPCPGVSEMLSWLTTRQIPFTLASSGPRRKVHFSLQSSGLLQAFPRFVCGDDVARAKPEPDVYLSAARLLAAEPGTCLAIEDAPNGVRAARAAGMEVVAVTTSFKAAELRDADLVVDSLKDLPPYLPGYRS
ncbi:MAG: HAD family phosphatase [Acidobacteriaceae bacterium]